MDPKSTRLRTHRAPNGLQCARNLHNAICASQLRCAIKAGYMSCLIKITQIGQTTEVAQGLERSQLRCSRSITSREVFWDFRLKDLVWEWFGLLLWTSHLPKYQTQPWSHVKWPGWWLGSAIPMFLWGLNCHQLHPPPLGPPDRLRSRLNIFRL